MELDEEEASSTPMRSFRPPSTSDSFIQDVAYLITAISSTEDEEETFHAIDELTSRLEQSEREFITLSLDMTEENFRRFPFGRVLKIVDVSFLSILNGLTEREDLPLDQLDRVLRLLAISCASDSFDVFLEDSLSFVARAFSWYRSGRQPTMAYASGILANVFAKYPVVEMSLDDLLLEVTRRFCFATSSLFGGNKEGSIEMSIRSISRYSYSPWTNSLFESSLEISRLLSILGLLSAMAGANHLFLEPLIPSLMVCLRHGDYFTLLETVRVLPFILSHRKFLSEFVSSGGVFTLLQLPRTYALTVAVSEAVLAILTRPSLTVRFCTDSTKLSVGAFIQQKSLELSSMEDICWDYPLPPCTLLPERAMWISLSKSIDLSSSSDSSRVQSHSAKVNIHLGSPNGKKMISVPAIASFSRPDTENVVSIGKVSDWTLPHLLTEFAVQQISAPSLEARRFGCLILEWIIPHEPCISYFDRRKGIPTILQILRDTLSSASSARMNIRYVAFATSSVLKWYIRAHLSLFCNSFTDASSESAIPSKKMAKGAHRTRLSSSEVSRKKIRSMDISDESVFRHRQFLHRTPSSWTGLVSSNFLSSIAETGALSLIFSALEIALTWPSTPPVSTFLLETLEVLSLCPAVVERLCVSSSDVGREGIELLLDLLSMGLQGNDSSNSVDHTYLVLQILSNVVNLPGGITHGLFPDFSSSSSSPTSFDHQVIEIEKFVVNKLRERNALRVILSVLSFTGTLKGRELREMRSLALKILIGMSRDPHVAHILNQLDVLQLLSKLMAEEPLEADQEESDLNEYEQGGGDSAAMEDVDASLRLHFKNRATQASTLSTPGVLGSRFSSRFSSRSSSGQSLSQSSVTSSVSSASLASSLRDPVASTFGSQIISAKQYQQLLRYLIYHLQKRSREDSTGIGPSYRSQRQFNWLESADTAYRRLEKSAIVAAAHIRFSDEELNFILYEHLSRRGLVQTASTLAIEGRLDLSSLSSLALFKAGQLRPPSSSQHVRSSLSGPSPMSARSSSANDGTNAPTLSSELLSTSSHESGAKPRLRVRLSQSKTPFTPPPDVVLSSSSSNSASQGISPFRPPSSSFQNRAMLKSCSPSSPWSAPFHSGKKKGNTSQSIYKRMFHGEGVSVASSSRMDLPSTTSSSFETPSSARKVSFAVQSNELNEVTSPDLMERASIFGAPATSSLPSTPILNSISSKEPSALDSILVQYLRQQLRQCPNPISVLPPLSLLRPVTVPTRSVLMKPSYHSRNVAHRILSKGCEAGHRVVRSYRIAQHHDYAFVHSRYRRRRAFRDYDCFMRTAVFLDNRTILAGTNEGLLKILKLDTDSNDDDDIEDISSPFEDISIHHFELRNVGSDLRYASRLPLFRLNKLLTWTTDFVSLSDPSNLTNVEHKWDGYYAGKFSSFGDSIVLTNTEEISIVDAECLEVIRKFPSQSNNFSRVGCFHPNNDLILADNLLFDIRSSSHLLHKFDKLSAYGSSFFSPHGNEVIIGTELWDLRTLRLLRRIPSLDSTVPRFSPSRNVFYGIVRDFKVQESSIGAAFDVFTPTFRSIDSSSLKLIREHTLHHSIVDLSFQPMDEDLFLTIEGESSNEFSSIVRVYEIGRKPRPDPSDVNSATAVDDDDDDDDDYDDDAGGSDDGDDDDDDDDDENSSEILDDDDSDAGFLVEDFSGDIPVLRIPDDIVARLVDSAVERGAEEIEVDWDGHEEVDDDHGPDDDEHNEAGSDDFPFVNASDLGLDDEYVEGLMSWLQDRGLSDFEEGEEEEEEEEEEEGQQQEHD